MILIGIILIIMSLFKLLFIAFPSLDFVHDIAMKEPAYLLFREVILILLAVMVVTIIQANNLLSSVLEIDLALASYCLLVAIAFWTVLGILLIFLAQKQILTWRSYERLAHDKDHLETLKE